MEGADTVTSATSLLAETPDSHEAFPRLTADQLGVLKTCGQQRTVEVGDVLYRAGERVDEVVAVLSGSVAVVQTGPDGDHVIEFTDREGSSAS